MTGGHGMPEHGAGSGRREAAGVGGDLERVDARIVYWGVLGAGKSTNLATIHAKLRPDHRGRLREIPTELDPGTTYEVLPIELGEVSGMRTRLSIVTVPDGASQGPTRKRLLDRVDGVVFVADARPDRVDANLAAFEELRSALSDYGRSFDEVPIVVQYNHRDEAELATLEGLHRKLDLRGAPVFEAIATRGTGVLPTLTTISKRVVRARRERVAAEARPKRAPAPRAPESPARAASASRGLATPPPLRLPPTPERVTPAMPTSASPESVRGVLDASFHALTAELHAAALDAPGAEPARSELSIASLGSARLRSPRSLEIPLVLVDAQGRETRVLLGLTLDPLLDPPLGGLSSP